MSRQASSVGCSLALEAHCGVAPPRHSDGYDSSARLALRSDSGAINRHLRLDATLVAGVRRRYRFPRGYKTRKNVITASVSFTAMNDSHDLQRFVDAQDPVYARVTGELTRGAKTTHWMWFIFPQLKGLGRSDIARHYGIASAEEAVAYWRHPLLGPRLKECTNLVLAVEGKSARQILGPPDDLKFCSSMTLFERVAPEEAVFCRSIEKYFCGERDGRTLALLRDGDLVR